jgi:hypothetical protein
MNNFTVMSYDQIIGKITQHKPDTAASIYLYESIELRHIVPVFFLKQRMKKQAVNGDGIHWRYADFCGWAAAYDDQLNDLYSIGKTYSDSDSVSVKRAALIHPIKVFQWESIQDIDESWDIEIKPPFFPWHFCETETVNLSRAQVHFWITVDSDLNQTNATHTATATVNEDEDDQTTRREPITTLQAVGIMAELLASLENGHRYRKGEDNVNAKAIGMAVSNRAKARFGNDVRGFFSFNKKISEGLKALEDLEKK